MYAKVSKAFIKALNICVKIFLATFIALFSFITLAAFVSGCTDSGAIGFAGAVAGALVVWAFVELYREF